MKEFTPNTRVIGIGFEQETSEDPTQCAEPWQLMVRAVRLAAAARARLARSHAPY